MKNLNWLVCKYWGQEMAGKIQDPLAVPYPKHRHFVTCHFNFLLHMVSLCFEAVSTEWGKQIPWSFKSYLGIFKQNVQD